VKFELLNEDLFCHHNITVDLLPTVDGIDLACGVVLCYIAADLLGFLLR
jgi:hypothetical protein